MIYIVSQRTQKYTFRDHFCSSMVISESIKRHCATWFGGILVISILDDIDTVIPIIQWQFHVRWRGYGESKDTWSSLYWLKYNAVLHKFYMYRSIHEYILVAQATIGQEENLQSATVDTKIGVTVSKNICSYGSNIRHKAFSYLFSYWVVLEFWFG